MSVVVNPETGKNANNFHLKETKVVVNSTEYVMKSQLWAGGQYDENLNSAYNVWVEQGMYCSILNAFYSYSLLLFTCINFLT